MNKSSPKSFFRRFAKSILITINFVFAILFLLGAYVIYFDPKGWWFLGLLTIGLPYLFLVLLIFFIFWLIARKSWALISLIAIALAWSPVGNIIPLNLSSSFNMQKDSGSMRILDWNIEHFDILDHKTHPEIKQKMLDLINEYDPDVACFQEMVGSEKPTAINYVQDIASRLKFTDYYYAFDPRWNFDQDHHFGIIILSKYPIIKRQMINKYPYDYNSIYEYVDLLVHGDTVRLFNIHLQSLRFTGSNINYLNNPTINGDSDLVESKTIISKLKKGFLKRSVQADNIRLCIDSSTYPVIVCGDFNDVPNSYAYSKIGEGLQNAFVKKGRGIGRTFTSIAPTLRIDNIFVDKRFTVTQFSRRPVRLVDHFPIVADVKLR